MILNSVPVVLPVDLEACVVLVFSCACVVLALASALPSAAQPLSQQLREIATVTVAVVNLEYEGSVLPVTVRTLNENEAICFGRFSVIFYGYACVSECVCI